MKFSTKCVRTNKNEARDKKRKICQRSEIVKCSKWWLLWRKGMDIEASHAHFVLVLFFLVYGNGRWQWMGWLGSAWAPFVTWRAWNFLRRIGGNFQSETIIICQRYMRPHLNGTVYLICLIFVWFLLCRNPMIFGPTTSDQEREREIYYIQLWIIHDLI